MDSEKVIKRDNEYVLHTYNRNPIALEKGHGLAKESQVLTISFNQNVTYVSGGAGLSSGDGTPTLTIRLSYHQNPTDNIGFGDLVVTSDAGLSITGVSISD